MAPKADNGMAELRGTENAHETAIEDRASLRRDCKTRGRERDRNGY